MPSSTFSSSGAQRGGWLASWSVALGLVLAGVGSWEVYWRGHGFVSSASDDAGLWALARHRANDLGEDAVVLVGSSRMQMDIRRGAFARATGWRPAIQLAVVRGSSVPVLQSLAEDSNFLGTVICEVNPVLFFADTPNIDRTLDDYFRAFEETSIGTRIEQRLTMAFDSRLVTRLPELAFEPLREAWGYGRLPLPSYNAVISPDRYRTGDYRKFARLKRVNERNARTMASARAKVMSPSRFARRLRELGAAVEAIRARGGDVVFVRLPSAIHVLEFERRFWQRDVFWEPLVLATSAYSVHYEDDPILSAFEPQDGDHLGGRSASLFSERLGRVLVERGIAPGPR